MVKPKQGWSPFGTETAETSISTVAPYSPRSVVANSRTEPCWRRLAISTLRSTPGRPSQRSSDSPRACSSVGSWARSRKAALAVRIRPSGPVTTKPSGRALDHLEQPSTWLRAPPRRRRHPRAGAAGPGTARRSPGGTARPRRAARAGRRPDARGHCRRARSPARRPAARGRPAGCRRSKPSGKDRPTSRFDRLAEQLRGRRVGLHDLVLAASTIRTASEVTWNSSR